MLKQKSGLSRYHRVKHRFRGRQHIFGNGGALARRHRFGGIGAQVERRLDIGDIGGRRRAARIVGNAASRRCVEVMCPSWIGTLRSSRISTRLPARSRSVMRMKATACSGRWR